MEFALPDLAGFAAAALLLILACALAILGMLIAQTFGRLPVVGTWVTANIVAALTDASNAVMTASKATWNFMVQILKWSGEILTKIETYQVQYAVNAWKWIEHLGGVTIPAAELRALQFASQLVTAANAETRTLFGDAERFTASTVTAAESRASLLFTTAETYAARLVTQTETALVADIRQVELSAASSLSAAEHVLVSGINGVAAAAGVDLRSLAAETATITGRLANDIIQEAESVAAVAAVNLAAVRAGLYTDLDTWGTQAVADAWPDAVHDLEALRQTLGADFPWLNELLPALAGAGALGLLGALTRSMAAANVITNLADDCIIPTCRNLSQLGNVLSELGSLAGDAALVAWLIFCVTDPNAAAQDMFDVAFEPLSEVVSSVSHLFGGP